MRPEELRIGNWVNLEIGLKDKSEHRIKPSDFMNIGRDNWFYSGIPLTPEWLERFGFEQSLNDNDWMDKNTGWFMIYESAGYYKYSTYEDVYGKQFNHVHQLQNLYYALTGEELTINGNLPN